MISFLKLYGYNLENRENILFLLSDNEVVSYNRDYKQSSFSFICKDCNISVYSNNNLKKKSVLISRNDGCDIYYKKGVDDNNNFMQTYRITSDSNYDKYKDMIEVKVSRLNDVSNVCVIDVNLSKLEDKPYVYRSLKITINGDGLVLMVNGSPILTLSDIDINSVMELIEDMFYFQNNENFSSNYSIIVDHIKDIINSYYVRFTDNVDEYIDHLDCRRRSIEHRYQEKMKELTKQYNKDLERINVVYKKYVKE